VKPLRRITLSALMASVAAVGSWAARRSRHARRSAVEHDFERGNIVSIDGWRLSATEARTPALDAIEEGLSGAPRPLPDTPPRSAGRRS